MNKQVLTAAYRVHLTRLDGQPIDTATGTLAFSHVYRRLSGKAYTPAEVALKWNKRTNTFSQYKGYKVERVEVYSFSA